MACTQEAAQSFFPEWCLNCPGFRFEWLLLAQTVKNVVGIFIGNLQEKSTAQNDLQAAISYQERVSFPVSYIG